MHRTNLSETILSFWRLLLWSTFAGPVALPPFSGPEAAPAIERYKFVVENGRARVIRLSSLAPEFPQS